MTVQIRHAILRGRNPRVHVLTRNKKRNRPRGREKGGCEFSMGGCEIDLTTGLRKGEGDRKKRNQPPGIRDRWGLQKASDNRGSPVPMD